MTDEPKTMTWERRNLFDPETVKKSTTITLKEKLRLIFKPSYFSVDQSSGKDHTAITRYKVLDNKIYILSVKHREKVQYED